MKKTQYEEFPCDLCGSTDAVEVPYARFYTNDQPIHICTSCGFVYVKRRRSAQAIADAWSDELYGDGYTARIPAVKARQTYVAEFIDTSIGLKGKEVCDIGTGEGQFLEIISGPEYGASVFGTEASKKNCQKLTRMGFRNFHGTIEDFCSSPDYRGYKADIATIMWTLENCRSCRDMLSAAYEMLRDGGHIVMATGSRILVPFKKPLDLYLSTNPADTHAFRFSANTLAGLLAVSGFEVTHVNSYIDTDYLCIIARKKDRSESIEWKGDDYLKVYDFFERWHRESIHYRN